MTKTCGNISRQIIRNHLVQENIIFLVPRPPHDDLSVILICVLGLSLSIDRLLRFRVDKFQLNFHNLMVHLRSFLFL